MQKALFFDCAYGISGDMTLGALLSLGVDFDLLCSELKKVDFGGYELQCTQVNRYGVPAKKLNVVLKPDATDNQYEKNPYDVLNLIKSSSLSTAMKRDAEKTVNILVQAQAKAHRIPIQSVHFHEKGAVDTLVDVIGTAIGFSLLKIQNVYFTPLFDGNGFIQCRCGRIPVPVPATREIVKRFRIPTRTRPIESELVTPTGAAIVAANCTEFRDCMPNSAVLIKTGAGAGDYDYGEGGYLKCSMYNVPSFRETANH